MVGVGQDERAHPGEPCGAGEVPQVGVVVRLQVQHVVQPPRREVREQVHAQIPTCEIVKSEDWLLSVQFSEERIKLKNYLPGHR